MRDWSAKKVSIKLLIELVVEVIHLEIAVLALDR